MVATVSGVLGRLWKNGTRRVRMAKMTRLWVASDSTNQPERNSVAWASKTQIMIPKVAKSKIELIGPKNVMKRRMKRGVPVRGALELLLVDVVGRDRHLAGVVEQVVEQDLRREHRQEAQEQRGGAGAEHVPEVRRGAHQDVLDRVGEDAAALDDAAGEDVEILVEQHDVGGVLGHVGRGLDGDADVGVVQRDGVVDAVAEESDGRAEGALGLDDPRLLLGGDAREDRRLRQRGGELGVVEALELGAGERRARRSGRCRRRPSARRGRCRR